MMNQNQLQKFIRSLQNSNQKQLVINLHGSNFRKGLNKTRELVEQIERKVRIQKLELAVKKMNITRSWV
ncbi:hypothetical protein IT412_05135 [Candidatus Peregrinibacteria bacterium]|nr:hypothetical protein [Candidatus Peregrinibacteria bacterium]